MSLVHLAGKLTNGLISLNTPLNTKLQNCKIPNAGLDEPLEVRK